MENIYVSLDEAREELKKRWNDIELRKKIEDELGEKFISIFRNSPRSVLNHQICSPDNGLVFFYYCAKYIGADPLAMEDDEDIFVSFNEEKKGLGRPRIIIEDGTMATVDIMNYHENEKKKLKECVLKTGENLVSFHHGLFDFFQYDIERYNHSEWIQDFKDAPSYYYHAFLHFIAHGVLFETFSTDDREGDEDKFVKNVILPSLKEIEKKFGLKPLIVRQFPINQTDKEDFFWWCYPPNINNYIVEYARKNKLPFKKI